MLHDMNSLLHDKAHQDLDALPSTLTESRVLGSLHVIYLEAIASETKALPEE